MLYAYKLSGDKKYFESAIRCADVLLSIKRPGGGAISGRLTVVDPATRASTSAHPSTTERLMTLFRSWSWRITSPTTKSISKSCTRSANSSSRPKWVKEMWSVGASNTTTMPSRSGHGSTRSNCLILEH